MTSVDVDEVWKKNWDVYLLTQRLNVRNVFDDTLVESELETRRKIRSFMFDPSSIYDSIWFELCAEMK
jgi:hypothetical protein